ncbi:MAG: prolipoprotein diacylglyceryl transferase [Sedimentisphaerales bacterium]|nr:prolipoprotein diacylglyceryl transferase [Sedimentisphaerales bacterium]
MYPELFRLPFTQLTVKSYGLMMVIGFLSAVAIIRRLSRDITPDPQMITNASLYALVAGVVGARLFYVLHYFQEFCSQPLAVFAIWKGGLELLGGVFGAIAVIILYLIYHKLPLRQYLDILAIGLMAALMFGRIGCFLNGCCYGKPTDLPWAVRFPYNSLAYGSQVCPDLRRNRLEAQLQLPQEYFGYAKKDGTFEPGLKPEEYLTEDQINWLEHEGKWRSLPVHPTELYSSANGALLCLILYLFWRRGRKAQTAGKARLFVKPGCTFALMFIVYGLTRFFIEFLRDDNPFEYAWWAVYKGGTISQSLSIYMILFGVVLVLIFNKLAVVSAGRHAPAKKKRTKTHMRPYIL